MYLPPQFRSTDAGIARELIRTHPLATLVSVDGAGEPFITHLPLHLDDAGSDDPLRWTLLGHCARANPHGRLLQAQPRATVSFLGPHAYMSPRVYPDLTRVPTWNYLAVMCRVEARLIESFDDRDRLLKHLIHDHDPAYADQWRGLGEDFQHRMMGGITAFELRVTELTCKLKLNQHRPESHAAMYAAYAKGPESQRALAAWMRRLGMVEGADSLGSVPETGPDPRES